MKEIQLKDLVGGALQEQFAESFEKVIENLQNPNTPYKAAREITIKLKFAQNEHRNSVKCTVQVIEKLAPQASMETAFAVGKNLCTGEVYAEEYGNQLVGQLTLDEWRDTRNQTITNADGEVVDMVTGEIIAPNTPGAPSI